MSKALPDLTIHSGAQPGDALHVWDADLGHGHIYIETRDLTDDGRGTILCLLDRDKARELFNWLGVWLHK